MPTPRMSERDIRATFEAVAALVATGQYYLDDKDHAHQKSAMQKAAKSLGVSHTTVQRRISEGIRRFGYNVEDFIPAPVSVPQDDDLPPAAEVIARSISHNARYIEQSRRKWRRRIMVRPEPFAIAFVGDPHLDNAGHDAEAMHADLALLAAAGVRCIQMGDLLDFFHKNGKLAGKQAANPITVKEAMSVARHVVRDSGVKWDAQILGNHDAWAEDEWAMMVAEWARQAPHPHKVYYWMTELTYDWGDGQFTVLAAHDFKGSSIYNPLHGNMKRALEDGTADLYASAHRHNAAKADMPNEFRGRNYWHCRVAGYKAADAFAFRGGFPQAEHNEGRSAVAVINPISESRDGKCRLFFDIAEGIEWRETLRARYE